jgi:hypothetical protein
MDPLLVSEEHSSAHCCRSLTGCTVTGGTYSIEMKWFTGCSHIFRKHLYYISLIYYWLRKTVHEYNELHLKQLVTAWPLLLGCAITRNTHRGIYYWLRKTVHEYNELHLKQFVTAWSLLLGCAITRNTHRGIYYWLRKTVHEYNESHLKQFVNSLAAFLR